jgi:hypothetical protein
MSKQTAVDWLFDQIPFEWSSSRSAMEALNQAKEMEKEQIVNAVEWNYKSNMGEVYYEAMYGGEK